MKNSLLFEFIIIIITIQMSKPNESDRILQNQTNCGQQTKITDRKSALFQDFDDMPIGGTTKFQVPEYSQDNKPTKQAQEPVKPKTKKLTTKLATTDNLNINQFQKQALINFSNQQTMSSRQMPNFEDLPIKSTKKLQIPEYAQSSRMELGSPKRPLREKPGLKAKKIQSALPSQFKRNTKQISIKVTDEKPFDQMPIGSGVMNLDEQPIGKSNNGFAMTEFPEGQQQPMETTYTMSQKLTSKAVKLRLSGFEELLNLLENDPNSEELVDIQIGKLLKQTNPACMEKILQCFRVWVQKDKKWEDDEAKAAIQGGYINGKSNTKKLTVQITELMFEKAPDIVEMTLLIGLKGKVPKTLAGYLAMINELISIFGIKKMKYMKPYMSDIVTILNRQKLVAVKTQGMNVLKQSYKWLTKDVMDPLLKDLKENLKKQLDSFWQSYDKSNVMTAPKDLAQEDDGKPQKKIDAFELSEAVDIFKKFNEKYSNQVLTQQKWSEKVKLMQDLVNAANVPKIANTEHRHITEMIRRLINHSNFNVVLWDLKILAALSKGLRKPFMPVVKSLFSNVIGKFRDKKVQMVDETFHTLNQFSYCISIEDVIDDVREGLCDKAPNMKANLINWIGKFVQKKVEEKEDLSQKTKDALKSLFPNFEKLLSDGCAEVRETMAKNIGKMKILLGDEFFSQLDKKMSKQQAHIAHQIQQKIPQRKVSKDKESKKNSPIKEDKKVTKKNQAEAQQNNKIKSKEEINQQISHSLAKLNHTDWQKRKQSAISLISLLQGHQKLHINCLHDLLNALKQRISDPNKNIIKYFVELTGIVFSLMSQKQVKANAKTFICTLADGLSDKMEMNRKQICIVLNKIGQIYGKQHLLAILGGYLDSDKDLRIQVLRVILQNEKDLQNTDLKEYPKGIIRCLCDRNKEIRHQAQKLFEKVHGKTGLSVFKNLARNERPAIAKDLNRLFEKYEPDHSIKQTPQKHHEQSPPSKKIPPTNTNKNKKLSTNLVKSSTSFRNFDKDLENETHHPVHATMNDIGTILKHGKTYVEGNEQFAPMKILSSQRLIRQQKDERTPWICDNIPQTQEEQLIQALTHLFKEQLHKKMLSIDYRKVINSASQIIKICKDIAHHSEIRQVYDLIFKWVFMRLWGGNSAIHSIIEVLPPVLSILQKKKLALTEGEVDIIVSILRQYFIVGYLNQYRVSQSLHTITQCLIALSSGDRLLKKFLKQFRIQLPMLHRHVKKDATVFYREGLSKLIKQHMIEFIGNQSILQEASKINELRDDEQFVEILYKRFHENVLDSFGFRKAKSSQNYSTPNSSNQFLSKKSSEEALITISSQSTQRQRHARTTSPPPETKIVQKEIPTHLTPPPSHKINHLKNKKQPVLNLNSLNRPPSNSPLGKNLLKLMPPNQSTLTFFTNLFNEEDSKFANLLSINAKLIFGTILQSVMQLLQKRYEYPPDVIHSQVTLLQNCIKCQYIIKNIGSEYLYFGTKFALSQLVYEDEHKSAIMKDLIKRGYDFKTEQFIKVINGVMLRILQNACPQESINILLRLLTSYSLQHASHKIITLIIKCLCRVTPNYSLQISDQRSTQFLQITLEYFLFFPPSISLSQFNPTSNQRLKPQENLLKNIKYMINQLIKFYGNDLWVHYRTALKISGVQEEYIRKYLDTAGVTDKVPEQNCEDQAMKQINEHLSKTNTFNTGIQQLRKYIELNKGFNPEEYFKKKGFDHKFIVIAINALEKQKGRRTPTKSQIRQQRSQNSKKYIQNQPNQINLQDRIQRLKKQFDEVKSTQNNSQQRIPNSSTSHSRLPAEDKSEQRAMQIKRKIDQMRNRMTRN